MLSFEGGIAVRYFFEELPIEPSFTLDGLTFDFDVFTSGEAEVFFVNGCDDEYYIDSISLSATSRQVKNIVGGFGPHDCRTVLVSARNYGGKPLFDRLHAALINNRSPEIFDELNEEAAEERAHKADMRDEQRSEQRYDDQPGRHFL
jgi:hypothetical protein